jgi:type II restriction enzyme
MESELKKIIGKYKSDSESVYHSWFINNDERLKAFRTIKKGVADVVLDIKNGTFGNDFKGSSLELVLNCITEQKQVFKGAAHPFYWKPKLRIPDIYENEENKLVFAQFLHNCLKASTEQQLLKEIILLDQRKIKGLGPAVASILYFIHPTIIPPCNTAIVNGFNLLFNEKIKLGSWAEYLKMREVILAKNIKLKTDLSNDLGCFSGLLFDIGDSKLLVNAKVLTDDERIKIDKKIKKRHKEVLNEDQEQNLHTEMQYHLLTIGKAIHYDAVVAVNDLSRCHQGQSLSLVGLNKFPQLDVPAETYKTISLIDAVWFEKSTNKIACAFEVEKSTSIYSGILRLSDLYHSFTDNPPALYLVIPDNREQEVINQLMRPSFKVNKVKISYILFSDLKKHCDALCKFGDDKNILQKIAKTVTN